jgi:hypothetical protein
MTENQWESALERIKSHPEEVQDIYESDYTSALGSPINVRLAFDEIALGESIYKIDYGLEFLSQNFDAFVNHRTPTIDEVKSLLKKSLEGSHGLLAKKLDSIHKFDHGPTISPILTAAICSRDAATIKTTFDSFPEYSCCLNLMDYTIERLGGFPRFPHALIYILHHGLRIKLQGLDDLDDAASRKKIAIVLDFYLSPGRKVKRTKLYYNIFCRLIMEGIRIYVDIVISSKVLMPLLCRVGIIFLLFLSFPSAPIWSNQSMVSEPSNPLLSSRDRTTYLSCLELLFLKKNNTITEMSSMQK